MRSTALRLVQEGEEETQLKVFYSTENTREYREAEEQWLEVGINSRVDPSSPPPCFMNFRVRNQLQLIAMNEALLLKNDHY